MKRNHKKKDNIKSITYESIAAEIKRTSFQKVIGKLYNKGHVATAKAHQPMHQIHFIFSDIDKNVLGEFGDILNPSSKKCQTGKLSQFMNLFILDKIENYDFSHRLTEFTSLERPFINMANLVAIGISLSADIPNGDDIEHEFHCSPLPQHLLDKIDLNIKSELETFDWENINFTSFEDIKKCSSAAESGTMWNFFKLVELEQVTDFESLLHMNWEQQDKVLVKLTSHVAFVFKAGDNQLLIPIQDLIIQLGVEEMNKLTTFVKSQTMFRLLEESVYEFNTEFICLERSPIDIDGLIAIAIKIEIEVAPGEEFDMYPREIISM